MVDNQLDTVFHALADPTRRGMLAQLALGETSVGDLAEPYRMTLAGASKHVKVLESAGLVRARRWAHASLQPQRQAAGGGRTVAPPVGEILDRPPRPARSRDRRRQAQGEEEMTDTMQASAPITRPAGFDPARAAARRAGRDGVALSDRGGPPPQMVHGRDRRDRGRRVRAARRSRSVDGRRALSGELREYKGATWSETVGRLRSAASARDQLPGRQEWPGRAHLRSDEGGRTGCGTDAQRDCQRHRQRRISAAAGIRT